MVAEAFLAAFGDTVAWVTTPAGLAAVTVDSPSALAVCVNSSPAGHRPHYLTPVGAVTDPAVAGSPDQLRAYVRDLVARPRD